MQPVRSRGFLGVPFLAIGLAFIAIGASGQLRSAFLGAGIAFLVLGAALTASSRRRLTP